MKVQAPTCHSYVGLYINNAAFHFQKWTINDLWPITTLPSQLPVCLISRDRHAPPHCCTHAFPCSGQATKAFLHLTWNMQASLFEPLSFYTASLTLFFFLFPHLPYMSWCILSITQVSFPLVSLAWYPTHQKFSRVDSSIISLLWTGLDCQKMLENLTQSHNLKP